MAKARELAVQEAMTAKVPRPDLIATLAAQNISELNKWIERSYAKEFRPEMKRARAMRTAVIMIRRWEHDIAFNVILHRKMERMYEEDRKWEVGSLARPKPTPRSAADGSSDEHEDDDDDDDNEQSSLVPGSGDYDHMRDTEYALNCWGTWREDDDPQQFDTWRLIKKRDPMTAERGVTDRARDWYGVDNNAYGPGPHVASKGWFVKSLGRSLGKVLLVPGDW